MKLTSVKTSPMGDEDVTIRVAPKPKSREEAVIQTQGIAVSARRHTHVIYCVRYLGLRQATVRRERTLSELEVQKEQIAYLKYWQGVMVFTDLGLVGLPLTSARAA